MICDDCDDCDDDDDDDDDDCDGCDDCDDYDDDDGQPASCRLHRPPVVRLTLQRVEHCFNILQQI